MTVCSTLLSTLCDLAPMVKYYTLAPIFRRPALLHLLKTEAGVRFENDYSKLIYLQADRVPRFLGKPQKMGTFHA